ncbi:MAG: thiamine pyrophosphate-binding protein [Gammaproteobacteria bacterium]
MTHATVSEILVEVLAEAGVRELFGIPGDAINGLVDAIRKQDTVRFIQVRHEEAGAFAAAAQAKLTGRLAACVGTAGGGAIHLLNGLYDARMDHAPVIAVTGQVATAQMGHDAHQEVDLRTLFSDVAEFNETVTVPAQIPHFAVQACQTALARRTVSHISLPEDIALESVAHSERRHPVFREPCIALPDPGSLAEAAEVLNTADKIAILAGIGCREARDELLEVANALGAPIIRSLRGKDVLTDENPYSLGGLGLLGTRPAVEALAECDALLMVGTDFPYEDFYPRHARAVQIDSDPLRLGKRYPVDVGLLGHARPSLEALSELLERKSDRKFLETAQKRMSEHLARQDREESSKADPLHPQVLARRVGDLARDDAIFAVDTGEVTAWAARHLRMRGAQRFTLSANLGSMAFALPAAIGAQLAHPDRQVIALAGDGGFGMLMSEFLTAVKYELPITVVVFNNAKLGLIQIEQEIQGNPEFQTALHNPDFAEFARICGGRGLKVNRPGELDGALEEAYAARAPCVVDVRIDADQKPMPPRVELSQAFGYGLAKVRELFASEGG